MRQADVIVVGGGHAGCEAALAVSRMGLSAILVTSKLESVARMSCNPAIGGLAKGQLVREIDALGGEMAKIADASGIQFRMLNTKKGPAVQSPRAQSDRHLYASHMLRAVLSQPRLTTVEGMAESIIMAKGRATGIMLSTGESLSAKAVIITTGTFLNGLLHMGEKSISGGRIGEAPAAGLSRSLADLGLELGRLKTGTPPRISKNSIDFSRLEEYPGDEIPQPFSFESNKIVLPQIICHITRTNEKTHQVIKDNLHLSPLYAGRITGTGPRYCPSIEDKVVRFSERMSHRVYVEPEGLTTDYVYLNGISTSLPDDVQYDLVRSIKGLEEAQILQVGYAVEYDFVPSYQLQSTLETHKVSGLYLAGQINGTSGYEEAAAQGLMAGINAALSIKQEPPFVLKRSEAYIGVLVDDLVIRSPREPYRMFTSRAEYRLILRQDNADRRLSESGWKMGLISDERYERLKRSEERISKTLDLLRKERSEGESLQKILRRTEVKIDEVIRLSGAIKSIDLTTKEKEQVEIEIKYEGYIKRQVKGIERIASLENFPLPDDLPYMTIESLKPEAKEKLDRFHPASLGQAARIAGVTPADISVLMVYMKKRSGRSDTPLE